MMKPQTSPHDLEMLSLYLDEKLNPTQRKRLEERLKGNQALSLTLDELRHTRTAYRNMPKVHSPRNFTLTQQMIGSGIAKRVYPAWGFVSALAGFLFVLILAGDLLGIFTRQSRTVALRQISDSEAAAPAAENLQEKSVLAAPTSTVLSTETPSLQAQEAFQALAPAANEPTAQNTQAAPETLAKTAPGGAETATPLLEGMYAKEAPSPDLGGSDEVGSSGVMSDTLRTSLPTAPAVAESFAQSLESTPTPTGNQEIPAEITGGNEKVPVQSVEKKPETDSWQMILWVLEGLFASTAIIAGMIVFFQKRKIAHDRRRG